MSSAPINQYRPESVAPPGETLLEVLAAQGVSQADLAERTGRPRKTINEIVKGKAAITPETALQLERVLGVPAAFWNNLEGNYRELLARREEAAQLLRSAAWLREVPISDLVRNGWVARQETKLDTLREVLGFFGVASPEQWHSVFATPQADFRISGKVRYQAGALAAWLRKGDLEGRKVEAAAYDASRFRAQMAELRSLTVERPEAALPKLMEVCAGCGVAVVFVPHLKGAPVHGAVRWLSPTKALIQLSLRYRSDDQLWFTFFHEAGHVLLHGKRQVFVDETGGDDSAWESAANRFAAELLVQRSALAPLRSAGLRGRIRRDQVLDIAQRVGVAPGIVVGRLQHDGWLPHTHLNDLKRRLDWAVLRSTGSV